MMTNNGATMIKTNNSPVASALVHGLIKIVEDLVLRINSLEY